MKRRNDSSPCARLGAWVFLIALLAVPAVLALSLAACGGGSQPPAETGASGPTAEAEGQAADDLAAREEELAKREAAKAKSAARKVANK